MEKRGGISRVFRGVIAIAAIAVLLSLIAVAGALVYVTTDAGEEFVHDLAVSSIESAGLGRLEVEELQIEFPPELRARRLTVSTDGHTWLSVEGFHLRPGLAALTARNLLFERLSADRVELHAPPDLAASEEEGASTWLRAILIKELAVEQAFLGPDLLMAGGEEIIGPLSLHAGGAYRFEAGSFSVEGNLGFVGLQGDTADGTAWRVGPGTVGLDLEGRAPLVRGSLEVDLARIERSGIGLDDTNVSVLLAPAARRGVRLSVEGSGSPAHLPEGVASLFGEQMALNGQAELSTVDFSLRDADLRFDGGGGIKVNLRAQADAERPQRLEGLIAIDGVDVSWPAELASVVEVLGREFALSSDFEFEPEERVELSDLTLDFGMLSAEGSAGLGLKEDDLHAHIDVALADLGPFSQSLGLATEGRLELAIEARGSLEAAVVDATASVSGLSLGDTELPVAEVGIQATGLPRGPGAVSFSSRIGREELIIRADGRLENVASTSPMITLALRDDPGNALDLSGELSGDGLLPKGRLVADIKTLASVAELFGLDVAGRIDADVRNDDSGLSGSATVTGLNLPGYTEIETLELGSSESRPNAVEVKATGIHFSGVVLDAAQLLIGRIGDGWRTRIALQDAHGAIDLTAELEVSDALVASDVTKSASVDGAVVGRIVSIEGEAGGREVSMLEPLVLRSIPDGSVHAQGRLGVGDGHMSVDWTVSNGSSFGEIHADRFPLRYITPFIDETLWLDGSVSADIVVPARFDRGAEEPPSIEIAILGVRVADMTEGDRFAGVDLRLSATQRESEIVLDARIGGRGREGIVLDGTVATTPGGIPFAGISADSVLSAKITGLLEEPSLIELAAMADARLVGRLVGDLRIGGTVSDPTLQGRLELLNGRYEDSATGAILQDLDIHIVAENTDTARLTLTGNDGEKGTIEGSGEVDISAGIFSPSARASVGLRRMRAARLDEVTVLLTGDLQLGAAQEAVTLSGRLTADELIVELPKSLPAEIVEITVVEENTELLDRPKRNSVVGPPGPVADLDVVIDVPGPAFVRSKEVKTDWRGRVAVGGTTAAITLDGGLDLIRGDFTALGVQVIATEGKIRLDPSPDARHTVDIRGRIKRQSVTVTVIVAGEVDDLSVRLRSEPHMPEDEILAFVLFGSSVSSLTPAQAVQLAVAVASLTSPRSAADPLAWVRDTTGLDRISIRERQRDSENDDEDENQSDYMLSAGKYVREGVFVSVDQPLGQGASEVSIELEVTETLTLKTSVGADATGNVGAAWTLDY